MACDIMEKHKINMIALMTIFSNDDNVNHARVWFEFFGGLF